MMPAPSSILTPFLSLSLLFGLTMLGSACDSIEPEENDLMVIEGFLDAGKPLPAFSITKALPISAAGSAEGVAINDANIRLTIDNEVIPYTLSTAIPGKYLPSENPLQHVPAGALYHAEITWQNQQAFADGVIPPPIQIEAVDIKVPDKPVAAILVDTLRLDTPQVGARKGYIYPIDVTIVWHTNTSSTASDSSFWVEARLRPRLDFSSTVLDIFLLTEEVQLEEAITPAAGMRRSWTGVYAVPVTDSLATLPQHLLTVQLIRSTKAYADFATSRNAPERREPVSNIDGAIGVIAGISLDSLQFNVQDGQATLQQ